MAHTASGADDADQVLALARQFNRLVGRRPSPQELRRYEASHERLRLRLPRRARRQAARLLVRL